MSKIKGRGSERGGEDELGKKQEKERQGQEMRIGEVKKQEMEGDKGTKGGKEKKKQKEEKEEKEEETERNPICVA